MILLRYVGGRFVLAWIFFWSVLTALGILSDLALRLDDLLEGGAAAAVDYYLARIPLSVPVLLPAALLFASVFVLVQFERANELVPMFVGGMSPRRLTLPFVACGVAGGILIAVLHQTVIPGAWKRLTRSESYLEEVPVVFAVMRRGDNGSTLRAWMFDPRRAELRGVTLREADREIECERMQWHGVWRAYGGRIYPLERGRRRTEPTPEGGERIVSAEIPPGGIVVEPGLQPQDLLYPPDFTGPLGIADALRAVRRHPDAPGPRLRLYENFSAPLAAPVLVLFGIALGLSARRTRSVVVGLALCLPVLFVYFGVPMVLVEMAGKSLIPPAAAVLLPHALFVSLAAFAWLR